MAIFTALSTLAATVASTFMAGGLGAFVCGAAYVDSAE